MKLQKNVYWYKERGLLDANTYIIRDEITVVIDPGLENYVKGLLADMKKDGIDAKDVDMILVTHLHIDHYGAVRALKEASGGKAKIGMHRLQMKYSHIADEVTMFLGFGGLGEDVEEIQPDVIIGDKLSLGNTELEILHTPGHSPDSICFYLRDGRILISGDLVFDKSIGRTDLPGGSEEELKNSIDKVSALDTELLLPGHMDIVRGKRNIERNYEFIRKYYLEWL
ncbi:MAG: MBL fold metallo-hydrolase [Candidatus Methanospirareceae archaeon]